MEFFSPSPAFWQVCLPSRGELPTPLAQFPQVDAQIEDAVRTGLIPGAVLVIGHNGQVIYRKAYGSRALVPHREPMTLDTIFGVPPH